MKRLLGIIECNYTSVTANPLSAARPAASLPFHGRYRLVDFALSNMTNAGVDTVGLIMPPEYRSIIDHVGAGKEWGLARKRGGLFPAPGSGFGTARNGGRFLISDILANKPLLTRNNYDYVVFSTANFVINIDYREMLEAHVASGADITVLAQAVPQDRHDADVVSLSVNDGRVVGCSQGAKDGQVGFLDAFIVGRDVLFGLLDRYHTVEHLDLFEALSDDFGRTDVRTYMFGGYAAPAFNIDSYFRVSMDLLDPAVVDEVFTPARPIKTKSHDSTPAKYESGCSVSNALVSSSCKIYGHVEDSVLGRHVVIEPGASVKNCIIMQGVHVCAGAQLENAIIDRNNTIAAETVMKGTEQDILYVAKSDDYRAGTDN